jgi:hypothetical protein
LSAPPLRNSVVALPSPAARPSGFSLPQDQRNHQDRQMPDRICGSTLAGCDRSTRKDAVRRAAFWPGTRATVTSPVGLPGHSTGIAEIRNEYSPIEFTPPDRTSKRGPSCQRPAKSNRAQPINLLTRFFLHCQPRVWSPEGSSLSPGPVRSVCAPTMSFAGSSASQSEPPSSAAVTDGSGCNFDVTQAFYKRSPSIGIAS